MTQESVRAPARAITPAPDDLAARIEEEIARLREKRPHLSKRIDRAEGILVLHLALKKHRPIRARVGEGRTRRFLVTGSRGATYVVDPSDWSCSCPDHHRRDGAVCKHALSCYVLERASRPRPAPELVPCTSCRKVLPASSLVEVTHEDESLTWFPGDRLCKACVVATGGIS